MRECIHVLWTHANLREACFVTITVYHVCACSFKGVDIALFSAGGSISKKLGPIASDAGCTVRPLACKHSAAGMSSSSSSAAAVFLFRNAVLLHQL